MTAAELAESVQFTVDSSGSVTAVVISPELWRRIMDALEDAEDRELVQSLQLRLAQGPAVSGALRWDAVADEWQ